MIRACDMFGWISVWINFKLGNVGDPDVIFLRRELLRKCLHQTNVIYTFPWFLKVSYKKLSEFIYQKPVPEENIGDPDVIYLLY